MLLILTAILAVVLGAPLLHIHSVQCVLQSGPNAQNDSNGTFSLGNGVGNYTKGNASDPTIYRGLNIVDGDYLCSTDNNNTSTGK